MRQLKIYLADLTHVGNGIATEGFPLNIGLIAAYAKKFYPNDELDIQLFKYPQDLKQALLKETPDILGCSNYTWNSNLSYYFCSLAKKLNPETLTVYGGTNYPFDSKNQKLFLEKRPDLDVHIFYEGEQAFLKIIERVMTSKSLKESLSSALPGSQLLSKATGEFLNALAIPRFRELDSVPSPYSSGLLDKFFDGKLTPLVETARGCPFSCNYCNAGDKYFSKVNLFSDEYVREELTYIAKKAAEVGAGHVTFADNNFGMIPRDSKTAELLVELQQKYKWPSSITVWTGKNSRERVIDVTRLLGDSLSISMSVQSMDRAVLKNIKRDTIRLEDYKKIAEELNFQGRPQHAEVIMPLPEETMASHISGLNQLLDTTVSRVFSHTLQMLHGTPYKDDEDFVKKHGYITKYRVVPLDFSIIDDLPIFDVEQVAVASNTLSLKEYVEARKYLFVIDLCYNSGVFDLLKKYIRSLEVKNSEWIENIYNLIHAYPENIKLIFNSFENESQSELWDSEEELVRFYSEPINYQKLVNYEMGGNVLFKHRVWMLARESLAWVHTVFAITLEQLKQKRPERASEIEIEMRSLKEYTLATVNGCFSPENFVKPIEIDLSYDVLTWMKSKEVLALNDFKTNEPQKLTFAFPDSSIRVMSDAFTRYGTDLAGLVKMVQRCAGVSFSRRASLSATESLRVIPTATVERSYGPGYSAM